MRCVRSGVVVEKDNVSAEDTANFTPVNGICCLRHLAVVERRLWLTFTTYSRSLLNLLAQSNSSELDRVSSPYRSFNIVKILVGDLPCLNSLYNPLGNKRWNLLLTHRCT